MTSIFPLIERLKSDYPNLHFRPGKKFTFRPPSTIIFDPSSTTPLLLLHELGHALLGHRSYTTDVERLKMESAAWEKAKSLAPTYNIPWDVDFAESELDTYRDWLHRRSKCPSCGLTRYQTPDGRYHCPRCSAFD